MRQPSRFSEVGFESMKMGVFLLFGRTKRPDLHRNSPPAFFAAFRWQLGARCSLVRSDKFRSAGVRLDRPVPAAILATFASGPASMGVIDDGAGAAPTTSLEQT